MGNSLSNQTPACCPAGAQDGVLVKVTVVERAGRLRARTVRYVPTWVEHPSFRIRPVLAALADRSLPAVTRRPLEAARDRTRRAVGPTGRPAASLNRTVRSLGLAAEYPNQPEQAVGPRVTSLDEQPTVVVDVMLADRDLGRRRLNRR
jgi:hypothetical protein